MAMEEEFRRACRELILLMWSLQEPGGQLPARLEEAKVVSWINEVKSWKHKEGKMEPYRGFKAEQTLRQAKELSTLVQVLVGNVITYTNQKRKGLVSKFHLESDRRQLQAQSLTVLRSLKNLASQLDGGELEVTPEAMDIIRRSNENLQWVQAELGDELKAKKDAG